MWVLIARFCCFLLAICSRIDCKSDHLASFRISSSLISSKTGKIGQSPAKITYEGLVEKLNTEKYPLFEFQSDLESVIQEVNSTVSEIAIENLLNKYLSGLQQHYFEEFCRRYDCHPSLPVNPLFHKDSLKGKILRECEVAFLKSIPSNMFANCHYEDYLTELRIDIDDYIESRRSEISDPFEVLEPEVNGFKRFILKVFTKDRLKWLLSQLLLFGINLAQMEVRQYLAKREVDKALAELPEFPLL